MGLITERLPSLYNYEEDAARRALQATQWGREDWEYERGIEKTNQDKVRALELSFISQGIPLPYQKDTTEDTDTKLQLLEDYLARQNYLTSRLASGQSSSQAQPQGTQRLPSSGSADGRVTRMPTQPTTPGTTADPYSIYREDLKRQKSGTTQPTGRSATADEMWAMTGIPGGYETAPGGGVQRIGYGGGGYGRGGEEEPVSLASLESKARSAGVSPASAYGKYGVTETIMSKADKKKILAQKLGMTEEEVNDPQALDTKIKDLRTQKKTVQTGEKQKQALLGGMQAMLGTVVTAKATGKSYTLDTYDEVVKWIDENTDWNLTANDMISLRALKFPPGGRVETEAFERKPETPQTQYIQSLYERKARGETLTPEEEKKLGMYIAPAKPSEFTLGKQRYRTNPETGKPEVIAEAPAGERNKYQVLGGKLYKLNLDTGQSEVVIAPVDDYEASLKNAVATIQKGGEIEGIFVKLLAMFPTKATELEELKYILESQPKSK